jgi:hypothetical protein
MREGKAEHGAMEGGMEREDDEGMEEEVKREDEEELEGGAIEPGRTYKWDEFRTHSANCLSDDRSRMVHRPSEKLR